MTAGLFLKEVTAGPGSRWTWEWGSPRMCCWCARRLPASAWWQLKSTSSKAFVTNCVNFLFLICVTNYHKLDGLKQPKFILSWFWRPGIWSRGVISGSRATIPLGFRGESSLASSSGSRHWLAWGCVTPPLCLLYGHWALPKSRVISSQDL